MRSLLDLHFAFLWIYIHTYIHHTVSPFVADGASTLQPVEDEGAWPSPARRPTTFALNTWSTDIVPLPFFQYWILVPMSSYVMYRMTHLLFWSIHGSAGVGVSELNGTNTFLIMVDHSRMARDFLRLSVPCFQKPRLCIEHGRTQSPRNPSGMDVFTSNFHDGCLLQVMIKGSLLYIYIVGKLPSYRLLDDSSSISSTSRIMTVRVATAVE